MIDLDTPKPGALPPGRARQASSDGAGTFARLCQRHGQPWPPPTFTVATPSGGTHLYFTAPPGLRLRTTAGRLGPSIDTRATGGYILAPGSITRGRAYTVITDAAPRPLPAWLADRLTEPAGSPHTSDLIPPTAARTADSATAALHRETRRVATAPIGRRNDTLNQAAFTLGQLAPAGHLPTGLAHTMLAEAARQAGLDRDPNCGPRGIDRTIRSGLTAGARKPRTSAA